MEYTVLLKKENNRYTATVPLFPGLQSQGTTEEEALKEVRDQLAEALPSIKFTSVDVPSSGTERFQHPWEKFAGMWKDDPTFDDFLSELNVSREEADITGQAE